MSRPCPVWTEEISRGRGVGYSDTYCVVCGCGVGVQQFRLKASQKWLTTAVALPVEHVRCLACSGHEPLRGKLDDCGFLVTGDGGRHFILGEYGIVHERCWDLARKPGLGELLGLRTPADAGRARRPALHLLDLLRARQPEDVQKYQQQVFDYASLVKDRKAWVTEDPSGRGPGSARSKARILERVKILLG